MTRFDRSGYNQINITISSNEPLGILDTGYIEDYFGVNGQLSVYLAATGSYTALLMNPADNITPETPNDAFTGWLDLSQLSDGDYELQGRVRDVIGNYTVLGAYRGPVGAPVQPAKLIKLPFTLTTGFMAMPAGIGNIFRVQPAKYMIPGGYAGRVQAVIKHPSDQQQALQGITIKDSGITSGTSDHVTGVTPVTSPTTKSETDRLYSSRITSGFTRRRYS